MPLSRYRGLPLVGAALFAATSAHAQPSGAGGTYTDRTGKAHTWTITSAHTLVWDGQPWVPVGGTFAPRYLAEAQTEENWSRDVAALDTLVKRGLTEVLVDPVVSAVDVPAAAWQRLVDHLDGAGFRYGIGFGAGMAARLRGHVVRPSVYRLGDPRPGADLTWRVPDADTAFFVLADRQDAAMVTRDGRVAVRDGVAVVPADADTGQGAVALLYPRRQLPATREGDLPDLWAGFDAYRDRMLAVFGQVKFGPGLRFFHDPLARSLGIFADAEHLVPDSAAFRAEWEAWLQERYRTANEVARSWGVLDDVESVAVAARLVPLWNAGRGVSFLLDPADGSRLEARSQDSRFWIDLRTFRNEAIGYYLNAAADLLKRGVANVPVVYTRTQHYSIYTNSRQAGGFDGLGMAAYGAGVGMSSAGVESVFSQCEEAARPIWCLVTETYDAEVPDSEPGYATRDSLTTGLDWLRGVGAKGFFVRGFQMLPEAAWPGRQLVQLPEQLGWLAGYREAVTSQAAVAAARPHVLPFPVGASGLVSPGPVAGGSVLWVPTLAPGRPLDFGSGYAGYTVMLEGREVTVLWSRTGPRETRIALPDPVHVGITTADGQPIQPKVDKGKRTAMLTLDRSPVIVQAPGDVVFPVEAAEDVMKQLRSFIAIGLERKLPVEEFRYQLEHAETNLRHRDYHVAFGMAAGALNNVLQMVQPFSWREAESAQTHTLGEAVRHVGASGGAYLGLSSDARPGREGYGAAWPVLAAADGEYTVWAACTPRGPNTSSFVWYMDRGDQRSNANAEEVGGAYLGGAFTWVKLGQVRLTRGEHTLNLRVADPAASSGRYTLAVDAVLVTPKEFVPNGIAKPALEPFLTDVPALPAARRRK